MPLLEGEVKFNYDRKKYNYGDEDDNNDNKHYKIMMIRK